MDCFFCQVSVRKSGSPCQRPMLTSYKCSCLQHEMFPTNRLIGELDLLPHLSFHAQISVNQPKRQVFRELAEFVHSGNIYQGKRGLEKPRPPCSTKCKTGGKNSPRMLYLAVCDFESALCATRNLFHANPCPSPWRRLMNLREQHLMAPNCRFKLHSLSLITRCRHLLFLILWPIYNLETICWSFWNTCSPHHCWCLVSSPLYICPPVANCGLG
jgi:hypothetical protein